MLHFDEKEKKNVHTTKTETENLYSAINTEKSEKWVKCTIYIGENGYNTHLVKPGIICYNVRWWDTPPMIL